MEEAQGKKEIDLVGWYRVQEDLTGLDFVDMRSGYFGPDVIKLAMCLRCCALIIPHENFKNAHLIAMHPDRLHY